MQVRRVILIGLGLLMALEANAQPRVRMNINNSKFDLEGYKIAIQELMARDKDPTHKDDPVNWLHNGYTYFANLHDFFDGDESGCIHGFEVFLPWHRELLYRFELAIRAAKPGRTDNLTIPYWDWTSPRAQKQEYPKAFTERGSPLYRDIRNDPRTYFVDTDEIGSVIVDTQDWIEFAGKECKVLTNCSDGQNCSDCEAPKKYGALEAPYHNKMHTGMGPTMEDPTTAVEDPIFWSFHAFIDQIYQRWQCAHQKLPVCMECNFRGMTDRKVRDVIDIERQLNYVYDNVPSCSPESILLASSAALGAKQRVMSTLAAAEPGSHERRIALAAPAEPAKKKAPAAPAPSPLGPFVFTLTIPDEGFTTADIIVSGLSVPTTFSYSGRVYLYAAADTFKPDDADFTRRHKVGEIGIWARAPERNGMHADHDAEAVVDIDVVHALRYLSHAEHGASYRVAIVFDPPQPLSKYVKSGAINATTATQQIHFTSVELVLDETRE